MDSPRGLAVNPASVLHALRAYLFPVGLARLVAFRVLAMMPAVVLDRLARFDWLSALKTGSRIFCNDGFHVVFVWRL